MRSYERNRVLVDQCTGCGGLFLDKGELEQLSAAEQAWHAAPTQSYEQDRSSYGDRSYADRSRPRTPRRKRSFLSELFDD